MEKKKKKKKFSECKSPVFSESHRVSSSDRAVHVCVSEHASMQLPNNESTIGKQNNKRQSEITF